MKSLYWAINMQPHSLQPQGRTGPMTWQEHTQAQPRQFPPENIQTRLPFTGEDGFWCSAWIFDDDLLTVPVLGFVTSLAVQQHLLQVSKRHCFYLKCINLVEKNPWKYLESSKWQILAIRVAQDCQEWHIAWREKTLLQLIEKWTIKEGNISKLLFIKIHFWLFSLFHFIFFIGLSELKENRTKGPQLPTLRSSCRGSGWQWVELRHLQRHERHICLSHFPFLLSAVTPLTTSLWKCKQSASSDLSWQCTL